jgi:hypothetical protein
MVVRMLREEIADKAGIGDLKKRYGALAELEGDLAKRAIVAGRQNKVGLVDSIASIESGADIAGAVAMSAFTGNPMWLGLAVRGIGAKAAGSIIKGINSPDANIARMFKNVEKLRAIPTKATLQNGGTVVKSVKDKLKSLATGDVNDIVTKVDSNTPGSIPGGQGNSQEIGSGRAPIPSGKGRGNSRTPVPQSKPELKSKLPVVAGATATGIAISSKAEAASSEVDMNKIYSIESSNNPQAHNKSSNAKGLGQITPIVLKEWNNFHPKEKHSDADLFNADTNKKIASWYMNKRIPQMLKAKGLKDTIDNRLIAYNFGIRGVGKILPRETKQYLDKYKKYASN